MASNAALASTRIPTITRLPSKIALSTVFPSQCSAKPCADQRVWKPSEGNNGYIMVTANGGINQQRVAVCNIVAVARLLNATLVIPTFMFSSVWRDTSQFADIYQEDYFIDYLKPDIRIVKELPKELQSLDLEAIGSLVVKLLRDAYERVKSLLKKHEKSLHALANALLEYETLNAEEIKRVLDPYEQGQGVIGVEDLQQDEGEVVLA